MEADIIDLNCDMGEGVGNDALLMPFISSANIACGGHAGTHQTMQETVRLCLLHEVAIGAHPSYEDPANFGRVSIQLPPETIAMQVVEQVKRLEEIAKLQGGVLHHVKPHGALYNDMADDNALCQAVCGAIAESWPAMTILVLSGSKAATTASRCGLRVVHEYFADRSYTPAGKLTPRSTEGALITNPAFAAEQALRIAQRGEVKVLNGDWIQPATEPGSLRSICLHGDGEHAVEFAGAIVHHFARHHISIAAPDV